MLEKVTLYLECFDGENGVEVVLDKLSHPLRLKEVVVECTKCHIVGDNKFGSYEMTYSAVRA